MKGWEQLSAEDIMSSPVVTLNVETPLEEAARTLSEYEMSGALVSDHRGAPVGVVSLFDIVSYLAGLKIPQDEPGGFYRHAVPNFGESGEGGPPPWEEPPEEPLKDLPVEEIMSGDIISVPPKLPLGEVAKLMAERHIHRVFVSENGPIGVISTMDILGILTGVKAINART